MRGYRKSSKDTHLDFPYSIRVGAYTLLGGIKMRKKLSTWGGRSSFAYEGSVEKGTTLYYGKNNVYAISISPATYKSLLAHFKGRTVAIGTPRTDPPEDSVGAWLMEYVTKTAIASYVGAILIREGYAEKVGGPAIKIK